MALYDKASLVLIPSGTKAGTVYSQKPVPSTDVLTDDTLNNGDFEQGSSGWTLQAGNVVFSNGNAEFQGSSIINQSVSGNAGETLVVTYTVESADANARLMLYDGSWFDVEDSVGTHTVSFVSLSTFFYLRNNDSGNITISSISAKKIVDGDFDFTRSTYATRVNSQGLIEKERGNLLLQSNNFDTTWSNIVTTLTGGQSGYDGSSDAWLLNSTTTGFPRIEQNVTLSGVQTFSIYAKSATDSFIQVRTFGAVSEVWFNLSDGTISATTGSGYISSKTEDIGSGWYRCSVVVNGSLTSLRVYPASAVATYSTSGNGVYIQDAQLEQGLVATDYIETTTSAVYTGITDNVPRLDYNGDCPSLSLEPQRQNYILHSEAFSEWGPSAVSVGVSQSTSPDGSLNAFKIIPSTGNSVHLVNLSAYSLPTTARVLSVFAKANGYHRFRINTGSSSNGYASFNLNNGTIASGSGGTYYSGSSIEDYGNGWYRCSLEMLSGGGTGMSIALESDAGSVVWAANGTDGIDFYGAQAEEGSYITSYIPTYGTSVTRNKDEAGQTSLYTFGSGAFSLFFEHEPIPVGSNGQVMLLRANPLDFYFRWTSDTVLNVWNQEIQQAVLNKVISGGRNQNSKICMVYDGVGSTDIYVNGVKEKDGYSFTWPDGPYNIKLDSTAVVSGDIPIHISQVMTFETALTNEEAIALTTV